MSVFGGPEFNDTGLALALDAGNTKSYVGYDATLVNSPVFNYGQGGYLSFNGSNTYATIPSASNLLSFGTADFSISFWIYLNSTAVNHTILTNYNAYNSGFNNYLFIGFWSSSGQINMLHAGGNFTAGATVSANTWAHICFTKTGTTFNVYLNGTLANTATSASNNYSGTGRTILIGGGLADFGYLNGRLALLTVSNTLFTAAQVSQYYTSTRDRFTSFYNTPLVGDGLVLNLDAGNPNSYGGSGTAWTDLSGNSNNGTLVNSPTFSASNGGSFVFNGSTQLASFNDSASLTFGAGSLTAGAFFKTTDSTGGLIAKRTGTAGGGGSGTGFQLYVYNNALYADGGGTAGVSSLAAVNDNTWKYGVAVYDRSSSRLILYINGNRDNTVSFGATSLTDTCVGRIASSWYNDYLSGSIANVHLYNRALSPTDIVQNLNALRSRFSI